jgi:hypothetical protein
VSSSARLTMILRLPLEPGGISRVRCGHRFPTRGFVFRFSFGPAAGLSPSALVFVLAQETMSGSGVVFICRELASFVVRSCVRRRQTRAGFGLVSLLFLLWARSSLPVPSPSLRLGAVPAARLLGFGFCVTCFFALTG